MRPAFNKYLKEKFQLTPEILTQMLFYKKKFK